MLKKYSFVFCMLAYALQGVAAEMDRNIYGYVEKALIVDNQLALSAKLDTGAKSASLSAIHIKPIKKHGKAYLAFDIPTKTGLVPFQAELIGKVKIKSRVGEHHPDDRPPGSIYRPMVKFKLQLGSQIKEVKANLTNRKSFIYPLLLGREAIIAFNGLIDPSRAFLLKKPLDEKQ